MRLIDADAFKMEDFRHCLDCDSIIQVIKYAPTIEAEPIVRCKDCEKAIQYLALSETVLCRKYMEYVPMKHYCGFGERRADNG